MTSRTAFALVICSALAAGAAAPAAFAANSLREGALAISVEADRSPLVGLKLNVNEKNALFGGLQFTNVSDGDEDRGDDGSTEFGIAAAYIHYWDPADFSPYSGASIALNTESNGRDATDWALRGFVGIEAFLMSHASVSGDLGLELGTQSDGDQTYLTTVTSAVRFNLYFK